MYYMYIIAGFGKCFYIRVESIISRIVHVHFAPYENVTYTYITTSTRSLEMHIYLVAGIASIELCSINRPQQTHTDTFPIFAVPFVRMVFVLQLGRVFYDAAHCLHIGLIVETLRSRRGIKCEGARMCLVLSATQQTFTKWSESNILQLNEMHVHA